MVEAQWSATMTSLGSSQKIQLGGNGVHGAPKQQPSTTFSQFVRER